MIQSTAEGKAGFLPLDLQAFLSTDIGSLPYLKSDFAKCDQSL